MLSTEEIKKLGHLARLQLTEEQIVTYGKQLNSILDYVAQLQEVDTDTIQETTHMVQADTQVLREDSVEACTQEVLGKLLANIPQLQNDFIKVPKAL